MTKDPKTVAEMVKPYTDYLDKEMTIQGVLSAFSVAAAGLLGEKILGAKETTTLHNLQTMSYPYVVATIIALVVAGFLFYAQRSWLALLLGQISLAVTRLADDRDKTDEEYSAFEWIDDADSWDTWNRYIQGLACLGVASVEFLLALIAAQEPGMQHGWLGALPPPLLIGCFLLFVLSRRRKEAAVGPRRAKKRKTLRTSSQ